MEHTNKQVKGQFTNKKRVGTKATGNEEVAFSVHKVGRVAQAFKGLQTARHVDAADGGAPLLRLPQKRKASEFSQLVLP